MVQVWSVQVWSVQVWSIKVWSVQVWSVQVWLVQIWSVLGLASSGLVGSGLVSLRWSSKRKTKCLTMEKPSPKLSLQNSSYKICIPTYVNPDLVITGLIYPHLGSVFYNFNVLQFFLRGIFNNKFFF